MLTSEAISFRLAPAINAAGRLGETEIPLKLFLADTDQSAREYAGELIQLNNRRRKITEQNHEIALELSRKELLDIYKGKPLKTYGKKTITSKSKLLEELEKIRKQGYAVDDEEYYEGVRCVAAPIRAGGTIVAALSITGSIFTMTMDRINQVLIGLVTKTAKEISSQMQW